MRHVSGTVVSAPFPGVRDRPEDVAVVPQRVAEGKLWRVVGLEGVGRAIGTGIRVGGGYVVGIGVQRSWCRYGCWLRSARRVERQRKWKRQQKRTRRRRTLDCPGFAVAAAGYGAVGRRSKIGIEWRWW